MDYNMDAGWQLHPIGGDTGQAYMGTKDDQRIFLKKNSSPFLAALSSEGITAKLIWTRRSTSGDILTAQEWLDGCTLKASEMGHEAIIQLLKQVHGSKKLLNMLEQVQGPLYEPRHFINLYRSNLHRDLVSHTWLNRVLEYLEDTQEMIPCDELTVCHGDLNHKNFLNAPTGELYLVDWENVRIADPISDMTYILARYIPLDQWQSWFDHYGLRMTDAVYHRVEWYSLMNLMLAIKQNHFEGRLLAVNKHILLMKQIYEQRSILSHPDE